MNEITLDEIVIAAHDAEFSQYDNVPEHVFSRKHNRAMKRIFKAYEKQTAFLRNDIIHRKSAVSHFRWNRKTVIVMLMVIFLAVLSGCAAIIYYLGGFKTDVYTDNTQLFPVHKVLRKCIICLSFRVILNYWRKALAILVYTQHISTAQQDKLLLFINQ